MKHITLEPVHVELDQLHLALRVFGQNTVQAPCLRLVRLHLAAKMLGVQPILHDEGPTRIDIIRHANAVILGEESMEQFHPRGEGWIEIEVAPKLAERKFGWFESQNAPSRPHELRKMECVGTDIGADIQY